MTVGVIIPCWNDSGALSDTLDAINLLEGVNEVIVADASKDAVCRKVAFERSATVVCCPEPGRGTQLNAGAAIATSDLLLFHHADSKLTQEHVHALRRCAWCPHVVGGAFHRKFDVRHRSLMWLEGVARLLGERSRIMFGDQSIFVRRDQFNRLGGFAEIPLMEDLEFSRRLRRSGQTILLDPPMESSPRRSKELGAWKTTIQNAALILLFLCGASPRDLHTWYYGHKKSNC